MNALSLTSFISIILQVQQMGASKSKEHSHLFQPRFGTQADRVNSILAKITETTVPISVLLIGDQQVGKSSILQSYKQQQISSAYAPTIGVQFQKIIVPLGAYLHRTDKGQIIECDKAEVAFWDTAGQHRFRTITNSFVKTRQAIIFVYDVSSSDSLQYIQKCRLPDILEKMDQGTKLYLLGNKTDLEGTVEDQAAQRLVERYRMGWEKVSARSGANVRQAINKIVADAVGSLMEPIEHKQIMMMLLLHLNEDFDDDLLQDAIQLLTPDL